MSVDIVLCTILEDMYKLILEHSFWGKYGQWHSSQDEPTHLEINAYVFLLQNVWNLAAFTFCVFILTVISWVLFYSDMLPTGPLVSSTLSRYWWSRWRREASVFRKQRSWLCCKSEAFYFYLGWIWFLFCICASMNATALAPLLQQFIVSFPIFKLIGAKSLYVLLMGLWGVATERHSI